MRKEYQKPALFAESFTLVEHVAIGCGYSITQQANHWDLSSCTWEKDGLPIFLNANSNCVEQYPDETVPYTCYDLNITATGDPTTTVYS